jgi:hypothetical protein
MAKYKIKISYTEEVDFPDNDADVGDIISKFYEDIENGNSTVENFLTDCIKVFDSEGREI